MPNWCANNLTLEHDDPALIKRAIDAFNNGALLQEFVPCPQELLDGGSPAPDDVAKANIEKHGAADWYSWCIEHWGTKWDINNEAGDADESGDGKSVFMSFDTAWGPPLEFYRELEDEFGFRVKATYFEPGMALVGEWSDGDNYDFAIDMDNLDGIPAHLVEEWDILSWYDANDEDVEDGESE